MEVWGWKEREGIERLHDRFFRWVLGVQRSTPGYMVREELQREMLKGKVGMRVWVFKRKLEEGGKGELARECWKELKGRARRGMALKGWKEERKDFIEKRNWELAEVERLREEVGMRGEELGEKERRRQREERWKRIRESRFNRWFEMVKGEDMPENLKKGWRENRW